MSTIASARERIQSLLPRCSHSRQIDQCHALLTTTGTLLSSKDSTFFHNQLIRAHTRTPNPRSSFPIFLHLLRSDFTPEPHTFPSLLKASSLPPPSPTHGLSVHAHALKLGFHSDLFVNNALVLFYGSIHQLGTARFLLDSADTVDVVSFNTMITQYVKAGDLGRAREVFDEMPQRDEVSWSAMIAGYAQCGTSREALRVFSRMQACGIAPSEGTLVSVLTACAHLGELEQGKWVHKYFENRGTRMNVYIGSALIDMYCKCGEVELGLEVFRGMKERNLLVWTTIIKGLAMHGRGEEALELFYKMERSGLMPDDITFLGVLCACTHTGLVDRGKEIFDSMSKVYGIVPKLEHYGCMVDLLARNGSLEDAFELVKSMPMEPDARAWGALLAGCRFHGDIKLAEYVVERLIKVEPNRSAVFVLLANIYAASGRHEDARKVRLMMRSKKVEKTPGCSSVEVGGRVHQFLVGDSSHPQMDEILVKWEEIERNVRLEGYTPEKKEVLIDVDEEEKEEMLAWHSEKLAVAFALINPEPGTVIRIIKNLRICMDCHQVIKIISKVYSRKIIVRDRTRFHIFEWGRCNCNDYW